MPNKTRKTRTIYRNIKRRVRSTQFTIPVAALGGLIACEPVQSSINAALSGNYATIPKYLSHFAGTDSLGRFDFNILKDTYVPIFLGFGIHKAASMLGVNRMLAQAKIPILRI